jgi:hypothetical protein
MLLQTWTAVFAESLQNVWMGVVAYIPTLVGALLVFIIGLIVSSGFGSLVERLVGALKVDALLMRLGIGMYFERAGLRLNSGRFVGQLVYWFLFVTFLLAASDILGFVALSAFLRDILNYIPNVIVAVLIMLAAVIVANFLRGLVKASVLSARLHAAHFLGALTWWSVVVFGLLAALVQLGIATAIINTVITGLVAMVALAGGIAFGLGGKDYAAHLLERLREHTEGK